MKIHHESTNAVMYFSSRKIFRKNISEYFHWHENAEFLYILSDGFKILVDGKNYDTKKGDLIFIGEHSVHCFVCVSDCVLMNLGQMSWNLLLTERTELKPIKTHITAEEIAQDPVFEQQLMCLMQMMESIGKVESSEKNLFAKSIFSAFYFALMERFPQKEYSDSFKKERKDFYQIIEYINEHITESLTVVSIAQKLFMDRGRLSKIFLKYSGMPVNDYINNLRISKANELLEKNYSVTDAAFESGFQSMRTFNNIYKKTMKITPSQYFSKKQK